MTDDNNPIISTTNHDSTLDNDTVEDSIERQDSNVDDADIIAETPSIMDAAKLSDSASANEDSMLSAADTDSLMQATLIGDYTGVLPCTSCDGISITLNLFADASMTKTIAYDNSSTLKVPVVQSGVYRQDANTITIAYEDKTLETYYIQGSHLVMLNSGDPSNKDYTLSRK